MTTMPSGRSFLPLGKTPSHEFRFPIEKRPFGKLVFYLPQQEASEADR